MDPTLKATIEEMKQDFYQKMAAFDLELKKSSSNSDKSGLAAEFSAYRAFIIQALGLLQQQIQTLAQNVDNMEMQRRLKILLLHGVTEEADENTAQLVSNVVTKHLGVAEFSVEDIRCCHRMGRQASSKTPRPILVKLQHVALRDKLWFSKTKLKGTGVTMSEFLTKARHDVFMSARQKFGITNCWTSEGSIYVMGPSGRQRVESMTHLNTICDDMNKASTKTASAPKTRRAAASKK